MDVDKTPWTTINEKMPFRSQHCVCVQHRFKKQDFSIVFYVPKCQKMHNFEIPGNSFRKYILFSKYKEFFEICLIFLHQISKFSKKQKKYAKKIYFDVSTVLKMSFPEKSTQKQRNIKNLFNPTPAGWKTRQVLRTFLVIHFRFTPRRLRIIS